MPTDIYFTGGNVRVTVEEEPGQVAEAYTAAGDLPFRLTGPKQSGDVYVNPSMVAFWGDSAPNPEPSPPEPEARKVDRNTVTDIWGQPLSKKPRR